MIASMATRKRLYFDADEELKIAVDLERVKAGADTVSGFLTDFLKDAFPESLREARKLLAQRKKRQENEAEE